MQTFINKFKTKNSTHNHIIGTQSY